MRPLIIAQRRGWVSEAGFFPSKGWNFFPSVSEFGSLLTDCYEEEPVLLVLLDSWVILRAAQATLLPPPWPVRLPTKTIRSERGRKSYFLPCLLVNI